MLSEPSIYVVRRDIENLVKLPQSFRKTTKKNVGKRVLAKQANIARVEPLGLVEERFALLPLASLRATKASNSGIRLLLGSSGCACSKQRTALG